MLKKYYKYKAELNKLKHPYIAMFPHFEEILQMQVWAKMWKHSYIATFLHFESKYNKYKPWLKMWKHLYIGEKEGKITRKYINFRINHHNHVGEPRQGGKKSTTWLWFLPMQNLRREPFILDDVTVMSKHG